LEKDPNHASRYSPGKDGTSQENTTLELAQKWKHNSYTPYLHMKQYVQTVHGLKLPMPTALPETKHCVIHICPKSSLAHPTIGRIKTLPPEDTHFRMSFKENPKHIHKRVQKTPLTIRETQNRKKAHKIARTDGSILKTNSKNCIGAAVVFKTNMNNYYRDHLTESLSNINSLLENSTNSCQKEKRKQPTTKTNSKSTSNKNNESARNKNSDLTNDYKNKNLLTANINKSSHRTLLNTNIVTTTYHSTLPEGPGSSLRSEL
jgi:hypothetical protein